MFLSVQIFITKSFPLYLSHSLSFVHHFLFNFFCTSNGLGGRFIRGTHRSPVNVCMSFQSVCLPNSSDKIRFECLKKKTCVFFLILRYEQFSSRIYSKKWKRWGLIKLSSREMLAFPFFIDDDVTLSKEKHNTLTVQFCYCNKHTVLGLLSHTYYSHQNSIGFDNS